MNSVRWNALLLAIFFVLAGVLGPVLKPKIHLAEQQKKLDLEQIFPATIGSWTVDTNQPVGIISPDVAALLQKLYAQTLSRTYVGPDGSRIMLSVAYGGDQSDATRSHRPDVCYPAQGFQIISSSTGVVATPAGDLPVRRMVAQLGNRVEPVTFWFTVGEYTAVSGQDQKLMQMKYGLRGIIPDGMLVRVSSIGKDEAIAFQQQSDFIVAMKKSLETTARARVFGGKLAGD
ncbi:EpsI family protein [Paucibacter sp. TC2R-5]|uniref:exosortase-associated protein EpsI, B-type n=1 Tax=Paucibacter sp. TC2R-5 TaxID=2893555 RepID=UPI0021E4A211|nr:exosortase-associated protein EpsI, B-type [Paucibacter sp. TC2R-5]MCV2360221.1 EpsI family protein [Paucibacter sp. TC2R-5]